MEVVAEGKKEVEVALLPPPALLETEKVVAVQDHDFAAFRSTMPLNPDDSLSSASSLTLIIN